MTGVPRVYPALQKAGLPHVCGLDVSLTGTGVASSLGWCELIGQKAITGMPLPDRLSAVDRLKQRILNTVGAPDLVVIEAPAFSRTAGGSLERSALWWLLVSSLYARDIPVAQVFPQTRMRYATGKGAASKSAIVDAVARRWPMFDTGGNDNLADAAVLATMGADYLGHPLADVPQTHRLALKTVNWPDIPAWKDAT